MVAKQRNLEQLLLTYKIVSDSAVYRQQKNLTQSETRNTSIFDELPSSFVYITQFIN